MVWYAVEISTAFISSTSETTGKEKETDSKDFSSRVGSTKGKWGGGNFPSERPSFLKILLGAFLQYFKKNNYN